MSKEAATAKKPAEKSRMSTGQVFRTIIWPRRGVLFIGLGLIAISRAASFVLPLMTQYFIDDVIPSKEISLLFEVVGWVLLATLLQAVTSFLLTRILSVEAQHLIAKLRVQVQKKILSLPIHFFDNNKSGALVSRIMSDVEGVRNLVGTGLVQLVGGTITAIVAFVFMLQINATMTLFVLVPMAIFGFIALKAFKYIRPIFRERGKINAEVTGRLTETLNGIRVVKGFNAAEQEAKSFESGADRLYQNIKKSLTSTALITSSGTFLIGITSGAIMGFGGAIVMDTPMTVGELMTFIVLLAMLVAPILQMSNIGSQLTEGLAGLDRTQELMDMTPEDGGDERVDNLERVHGDMVFEDVSFSYETGKEVLHNVSFDAPAGSVTALVGTSGSGKSTIAGLAASFFSPQEGRVLVDGKDLSKVTLSSYRSQLGVVLQDDFLFEGTIRENVIFPRPDSTDDEVQKAVEAAYVHEFSDRFDDGLDTLIGERGVKLSGGQRQRIAIARALLADPRVLLLDEATSNLDTESESFIQESLKRLMEGRTTFVIAHRLSTIRQADQILVIEDGRIAEQGTHDELIAKEGRYYQLYTYQARI
jgi:ABC-type multidrug transport system fused ATPase/permease subunit